MNIYSKNLTLIVLSAIIVAVLGSRVPTYRCEGPVCRDPADNSLFPCRDRQMKCCFSDAIRQHVLIQEAGIGFECCDGSGEVYDISTEVCDNKIVRKKRSKHEVMCLSEVYDERRQECCVAEGLIAQIYDKEPNGKCCNGSYLTDQSVGCCTNQPYSKLTQTCCRGTLHELGNADCCADLAYDRQSHMCIEEITIVNIEDYFAPRCGGVSYDNKSMLCCNNEIHPKNSTVCYEDSMAITKQQPDHTEACNEGGRYFITFNPVGRDGTKLVCAGNKLYRLRPEEDICGLNSHPMRYNTNRDLCCGGVMFAGEKREGRLCCHGAANFYRPARATCCGNRVHEDISEKQGGRCCRDAVYDSKTQMCDENQNVVTDCGKTSLPDLAKSVGKGIFIYKANLNLVSSMGNHRAVWGLRDVTQLKGKGKKKIKAEEISRELKILLDETACYQQAVEGETYLVVSNKQVSSRISKKNKKKIMYVFPITVEYESLFGN